MTARTSTTHPLQIAEVSAPGAKGRIGITFCPGKKQVIAMSGAWDRDLGIDLDAIKAWGASAIITLIEPHEIKALKVEGIDEQTERRGMEWLHMPITDVSAPDDRFEMAWRQLGARLIDRVRAGDRVLVHCKGGLGRAGTVAALMLVELGMASDEAIGAVRRVREGAIETLPQEKHVHGHAAKGAIVLEVGSEGGSIQLRRRRIGAGPEFRVQASEAVLCEDDSDLALQPRPWVSDWEAALEQLDSYPWTRLYPLSVHPDIRDAVAVALKRRVADGLDWTSWNRVLMGNV